MNTKTKVLIVTVIVVVISALLYVVKLQNDLIKRQESIEKSFVEQKELADNISRSQSSLVTKKDLEKFAKENKIDLTPIIKDLKKLDAKVKGVQTVRVISSGYSGNDLSSDSTTSNPNPEPIDPKNPDPHGYLKNRQVLKLEEPFGEKKVPIGEVGFSAWKEKPWDLKIEPRQYNVVNVLGMDEKGRHYTYSKFFIVDSDGTSYDVKITDSKFREELPSKKFRLSPRLYAGIDAGAYVTDVSGAVIPNLQLSLFSLGLTKNNPDWTFIGLGFGYEIIRRDFSLVLSPVSYNIGNHLPLVNNIYIRPTVSLTSTGDFTILGGLGFGL